MSTTQQHLLISDIKDNIVTLKDGGGALVLSVGAVNFGLLSEREQIAIISAFAQMLNSLSYPIQIVIRSERLNISSYLKLLDKAQQAQTNPLLSQLITNYRQFIQTTIKENEVLDKKFYVVIPLYSLELGFVSSKMALQQKIKTVLLPRRDQVIRQLSRVGLRAAQLTDKELIELFYDIYNGQLEEKVGMEKEQFQAEVSLKKPQSPTPPQTFQAQQTAQEKPSQPPPAPYSTGQPSKTHPFVVEELE